MKISRVLFFVMSLTCRFFVAQSQSAASINGFVLWITGRDSATIQLLPLSGLNALTTEDKKTVAHVKFKVIKYGEVSFPINPASPAGSEALPVDLSKSRFIKIRYKANHDVILQLRQTAVHGGVHNHVILPASDEFITRRVYFSSFAGGLKPLDLKNVSKFNFAFLGNNREDGFSELIVQSVKIHGYNLK